MFENSSITNGRMRFIGGLLRVDSGGRVEINGTLTGIGELLWNSVVKFTAAFTSTGITRFEGDTSQVGPFHVEGVTDITGPSTTVTGPWHLDGDGDVKGDVGQTGTWTVDAPGQIIIAGDDPITLGAATPFGVGVGFSTGAVLSSTAAGAALYGPGGDAAATVGPNNATIGFNGKMIVLSATGARVAAPIVFAETSEHVGKATFDAAVEMDLPTIAAYGGLPAGVVVINATSRRLYRTI
jgi:hypothetical protein